MEDDYDRRQNHSEEEIPVRIAKELPVTFGGFTIRESWDIFFSSRGSHDFSEWYADWPQLQTLLVNQLLFPSWNPPHPPADVRILVPACGNSRLSEHLYDDGFTNITNVDFSKAHFGHGFSFRNDAWNKKFTCFPGQNSGHWSWIRSTSYVYEELSTISTD